MKKSNKVTFLTQAAVIAAIYVVLTIIFAPFSFGEVQVRISEALTVLPFFTPAAIPGLFAVRSFSSKAAACSMVSPFKTASTIWISASGVHCKVQCSAQVARSCPFPWQEANFMPST